MVTREPCVRCRAVKWAIVTAVVHAVEAIAAAQIWANAVCRVTSPEYPVYNERRDSQPYGDDMGERRRRRANGEFM